MRPTTPTSTALLGLTVAATAAAALWVWLRSHGWSPHASPRAAVDHDDDDGGLLRFHSSQFCTPPCPIHAPSDHHMVDWPKQYRLGRGIFERTCDHGVGHPDPDSIAYLRRVALLSADVIDDHDDVDTRVRNARMHGCDGCCVSAGDREQAVPR